MRIPELLRFTIEGAENAVRLAGEKEEPALLHIYGLPSSTASCRKVFGPLA
jgi:hypothetical protein